MNVEVSNSNYAEVWQNERYWPINGWDSVSNVHFSDVIGESGYEKFPQVDLPDGWEWISEWEIDKSKRFGDSDANGYMYATNYERLLEMIRFKTTTGTPSATSLVRRRCYVRGKKVVNITAKEALIRSVNVLIKSRNLSEEYAREKRFEWNTLIKFENSRLEVFTELAERCRIANSNSMELMKLLISNLNMLCQFLTERASLELEYSQRIHQLSLKYGECSQSEMVRVESTSMMNPSGRPLSSNATTDSDNKNLLLTLPAYNDLHAFNFDGMNFTEEELVFLDKSNISGAAKLFSSLGFSPSLGGDRGVSSQQGQYKRNSSKNALSAISSGERPVAPLQNDNNEETNVDVSCGFFNSVSWATRMFSMKHQNFSAHVLSGALSEDITSFLAVLNDSLKQQEINSKNLSDQFRGAEEELKNAAHSLQKAYHAATSSFENNLEVWNQKIVMSAENGGEVTMSAATEMLASLASKQIDVRDASTDFEHLGIQVGSTRMHSSGCDYEEEGRQMTSSMPPISTSLAIGTLTLHSINSTSTSTSLDSVPSSNSASVPNGINRFSSLISRSFVGPASDQTLATPILASKLIDAKESTVDDIWLKVQVYRSMVWNATEKLQLILKGVKKNLCASAVYTSKAKLAFLNTMEVYTFEQNRVWSECADNMTDACDYMLSSRQESVDVLEEKIVKRQKLNEAADFSVKSKSNGRCLIETFQQMEALLVGGLSLPLVPSPPTVILEGQLKSVSISDVMLTVASEAELEEMWLVRYIVVTMDGFVHVCAAPVNNVDYFIPPLQSFCIKACEIGCASSCLGPIANAIEIRPNASSGSDGIVLQTKDQGEAYLWSNALANPLTAKRAVAADHIEIELPQQSDAVRVMESYDEDTSLKSMSSIGGTAKTSDGNNELMQLQHVPTSAVVQSTVSANASASVSLPIGESDNVLENDSEVGEDEVSYATEGKDEEYCDDDDDDMDGLVPVIHCEFATAAVVPTVQEAGTGNKMQSKLPTKPVCNVTLTEADYDKDETFRPRNVNPSRYESSSSLPHPPKKPAPINPVPLSNSGALRGQNADQQLVALNNKWIVNSDSPVNAKEENSNSSSVEEASVEDTRMSRRRSSKIIEYEAGVKQQQVEYSNRVTATRGQTLKTFGIGPDGSKISPTGESVSRLSQKFDTPEYSPTKGKASAAGVVNKLLN